MAPVDSGLVIQQTYLTGSRKLRLSLLTARLDAANCRPSSITLMTEFQLPCSQVARLFTWRGGKATLRLNVLI